MTPLEGHPGDPRFTFQHKVAQALARGVGAPDTRALNVVTGQTYPMDLFYANREPPGATLMITIPKTGKPPSTLVSKTLIQGTGPAIASGQQVIVQYVGMNWRTGKIFDSSEADGDPFGFVQGLSPQEGGVITGWDTGLKDAKVGSRVLLVIPPKDGYGSTGNSQAGIKGTDTLVFVIDVLGAYSAHTT